MLVYAALLAVVLVIVNVFPPVMMEKRMIDSAQKELIGDGNDLAAALKQCGEFDRDAINNIIVNLTLSRPNRRIIVVNSNALVVYDSYKADSSEGKIGLYSEVLSALDGNSVFYRESNKVAFDNWAAVPIKNGEDVKGAVYMYQRDTYNAALLDNIRGNIQLVSFAVIAISALVMAIFNKGLGKRFSQVLEGVRQAGSGNFNYRIKMKGKDELVQIAGEFNELSERIQKSE